MANLIDCIKSSRLHLLRNADITNNSHYAFWKGTGKILLQAHVDTIFPCENLKITKNIISGNGLGADDRAGVFTCLHLKEKYPDTPILLTNFEESGGTGMNKVCFDIAPEIFKDVNLAIAIDRHGCGHYVTYNDLPSKCKKYVNRFGWHEENGTFSDIEIFTDFYGIPSINVSCGYYNEHTKNEYLVIDELLLTIKRLERMLMNPIIKRYKPKKQIKNPYYMWNLSDGARQRFLDDYKEYYDDYYYCPFCYSDRVEVSDDMCLCWDCGERWNNGQDGQVRIRGI